ncbi:GNAT family N-acetyltransferase [Phreatobacter sp.]|uniref:GNAT family N-acetyltransferase n=1 Tax=Phreatobacter sp. TaxID=1966341 RepID=UPI0022BB6B05|nr:GNAT family N-acetyltransferase [Phreatobacter sp.]MCZ8315048.1 GNAT family N-acetyltransferase [Phreatobacter sp.]
MSDGVDIRVVGPGDAVLFARVAPDVFDGPVDPGRLAAYLATPGHAMALALAEGEVVGQVAGVIHRHPDMPDELYIDNLGVTPALHRQGIGRRLIEALMAEARRLGCREAWVATETDNRPARALYRRLGPTEETRVAYYLYDL